MCHLIKQTLIGVDKIISAARESEEAGRILKKLFPKVFDMKVGYCFKLTAGRKKGEKYMIVESRDKKEYGYLSQSKKVLIFKEAKTPNMVIDYFFRESNPVEISKNEFISE